MSLIFFHQSRNRQRRDNTDYHERNQYFRKSEARFVIARSETTKQSTKTANGLPRSAYGLARNDVFLLAKEARSPAP